MSTARKLDLIEADDLMNSETRSGRAVWDSRGNSTWEWQTLPGVFSKECDTQMIRALADHLELEERVSREMTLAR